jgi:hypothetical protein
MGPSFAFMQKRYARSGEQQKSLLESRLLAVRTGLEPATLGVTGRYSNQLNYRTKLVLPRKGANIYPLGHS